MISALVSTDSVFDKDRLYRKVLFMGLSAVLASVVIIACYNQSVGQSISGGGQTGLELAAVTLMPYMVSAIIATITAIGVTTILPAAKVAAPAEQIVCCLRDIGDGDLTARIRLGS